jgi:diaminopimelate decarboxylase
MTKLAKMTYRNWIEQFGSPLFVLDEAKLLANVDAINSAFKSVYSRTQLAYSIKTNYNAWICKRLFGSGLIPEVISGFELELVEHLGYLSKAIVNGPVKSRKELTKAMLGQATIHIDNLTELKNIIELASDLGCHVKLGIRLRPEGEAWKRFGIALQGEQFEQAMTLIRANERVELVALHLHIGTSIIDCERYRHAGMYMVEAIKRVNQSLDTSLSYIDMGGGLPTQAARLNHYAPENWLVPRLSELAEAIVEPLENSLQDNQADLVIEPGRAIVDDAVFALTSVYSVEGNRVLVDAGKNLLPSVEVRVHPIFNISNDTATKYDYDVFGPLCMGSDVLAREQAIAECHSGDILKIDSVGAYCQSQGMQFIKYQPAMIVLSNEVKLIRKAQDYQHLFALDII